MLERKLLLRDIILIAHPPSTALDIQSITSDVIPVQPLTGTFVSCMHELGCVEWRKFKEGGSG